MHFMPLPKMMFAHAFNTYHINAETDVVKAVEVETGTTLGAYDSYGSVSICTFMCITQSYGTGRDGHGRQGDSYTYSHARWVTLVEMAVVEDSHSPSVAQRASCTRACAHYMWM